MSSEIINTTVEEYKKLVESLHSENYEMMVDLTVVAVSYTHLTLPTKA